MLVTRRYLEITLFLLLMVTVGVISLGIMRKLQLDRSSQELALTVTESVLAGNIDSLVENGSAELLQSQSGQMLQNYVTFVIRALGPLRTMQSITGTSKVSLFIFGDEAPTASYTLALEFDNALADAVIEMRQQSERWQITSFTVQSDYLAE